MRTVHSSTVDILGAAGVYTTVWVQVSLFPLVQGAATVPYASEKLWLEGYVLADQDSAVNGFQVQQSDDGATADLTLSRNVWANGGQTFEIKLFAKFVRIVYTNGAVAQTAFDLHAYLVGDT